MVLPPTVSYYRDLAPACARVQVGFLLMYTAILVVRSHTAVTMDGNGGGASDGGSLWRLPLAVAASSNESATLAATFWAALEVPGTAMSAVATAGEAVVFVVALWRAAVGVRRLAARGGIGAACAPVF